MNHKKPTKLKKLQGTFRKDRAIANEVEFTPLNTLPRAPRGLNEVARHEWNMLIVELDNAGILNKTDLSQLEQYCYYFGMYRKCQEELGDDLTSTITNKGGFSYEVVNPLIKVMNDATAITNRIAAKFGFDPASRTRVAAPKKKEEEDPLAGAVKMKAS